jgi:hypothetical protein
MPRPRLDRLLRRALGLPLALLCLAAILAADTVILKDGRRIEGTIKSKTATHVVVATAFGELTFELSAVEEIVTGKTKKELLREKRAACKTGEDFYQLGLWCEQQKMASDAKGAYRKAIEVDPDHAAARGKLGFVQYKGEWMTPEQRDVRMKEDYEADMRAKGFVLHDGRWITPEEKLKLEQGLVLYKGEWLPKAEAMRLQGFLEFEGRWLPKAEALGWTAARDAEEAADRPFAKHITSQALLVGNTSVGILKEIGDGLDRSRGWFDETWEVEPGLKLFGRRLAEFYVFDDDSQPYLDTVDWIVGRSNYVPEGWADSAKATYGFVWIDPIAISSARQNMRPEGDLVGNCYHHMGHMMLNRLGYEGRLLPAWYDEGMAALCELRTHGRNAVFCRSSYAGYSGTSSGKIDLVLDDQVMRDGSWRSVLREALQQGAVPSFDKLALLEFSQLSLRDIATSMAIVEWLEKRGDGTLKRFHAELRKGAPPAPNRVIQAGADRLAYYDRAFEAATGLKTREADREWRNWFLKKR